MIEGQGLGHLPPHIVVSLGQFVEGVIDYEPLARIERVMFYGNFAEDGWDPQGHINLGVVVSDQRHPDAINAPDPRAFSYLNQFLGEVSPHQRQLAICGVQQVTDLALWPKFKVAVCVASDFEDILRVVSDGRGPLGDAISRGIQLYPNSRLRRVD